MSWCEVCSMKENSWSGSNKFSLKSKTTTADHTENLKKGRIFNIKTSRQSEKGCNMIKSDQNQHFLYFGLVVWRMSSWIQMKGYPVLAPPPCTIALCPGGEIKCPSKHGAMWDQLSSKLMENNIATTYAGELKQGCRGAGMLLLWKCHLLGGITHCS